MKITRLVDLASAKQTIIEMSPEEWVDLRKKAQDRAMSEVPRELLGKYRDQEAKKQVRYQVVKVVEEERPGLDYQAKNMIVERLTNEISGYGPLEKLLDDPDITEILVETFDKVVIEKDGGLQETNVKFDSEEHLRLVVERIISPLGRRLDWASPIADGRLPDGSRVCAIAPPVAVNGAQLSIRKFKPNISIDNLVDNYKALPRELRNALEACVRARLSIVVSGGTGSGKSTFLNALSEFINPALSIITIENPIELQLKHPRVRSWEARPANIEGKGEIDMMYLLITALRSRPDIIIVGEIRGREAFVFLQAVNTGHDGSMTSLHANNTKEAMKRVVSMVSSAEQLAPELVPEYVSSGIDIIVHLSRMPDKSRKVVEVAEVTGVKSGVVTTNSLVKYKIDGYDGNELIGHWEPTGNKFTREERFKEMKIEFPGWLGGGS